MDRDYRPRPTEGDSRDVTAELEPTPRDPETARPEALERFEAAADADAMREALADFESRIDASEIRDFRAGDHPGDVLRAMRRRIERAEAEAEAAARPKLHPLDRPDPLPPAADWLLADRKGLGWLPSGRLAALSGDGALGKSHFALAVAAAVAGRGGGALPLIPDAQPASDTARLAVVGERGDAVVATWEDDAAECWRRVLALKDAGAAWAFPEALDDRLHFVRPDGPVWAPRARGNAAALAVLTATGEALLAHAAERRARLLVLDPVAGAFGAAEIDRAQVRAFCAHLDAWSREHGCAVLLVQHPPKAERSSGGQSGSTDWRNAPRAVLTLTLEPDPRDAGRKAVDREHPPLPTLAVDKSNSGRRPDPLTLERRAGEGGMHWREAATPAGGGDDWSA